MGDINCHNISHNFNLNAPLLCEVFGLGRSRSAGGDLLCQSLGSVKSAFACIKGHSRYVAQSLTASLSMKCKLLSHNDCFQLQKGVEQYRLSEQSWICSRLKDFAC